MATSSATFFRQMGGTLGVAVFLSLLFNTLGDNVKTAFLDAAKTPEFLAAMRDPNVLANPVNAQFVKALTSGDTSALASVSSDSSLINKLDPVLSHPFKVGFSHSMDTVFLVGAIVCAVGFFVLLFMPKVVLSGKSASAQLKADARKHTLRDDLVEVTAIEAGGHTMEELDSGDDDPRSDSAMSAFH